MFSLQELVLEYLDLNGYNCFRYYLTKNTKIPYFIAEKIIVYLDNKNFGISNKYLKFFSNDKTILRTIKLSGYKLKYLSSLSFLQGHELQSVDVKNINIPLKKWIYYINNNNLQELSIQNCKLDEEMYGYNKIEIYNEIHILERFKYLLKLNVCHTKFTNECLKFVCHRLLKLEELNISETNVYDIHSIKNLIYLKKFIFYHKYLTNASWMIKQMDYLVKLKELTLIAVGNDQVEHNCGKCKYLDKFFDTKVFQSLEYFIIGGTNWHVNPQSLQYLFFFSTFQLIKKTIFSLFFFFSRKFISNHEKMQLLAIDYYTPLNDDQESLYNDLAKFIYPARLTVYIYIYI